MLVPQSQIKLLLMQGTVGTVLVYLNYPRIMCLWWFSSLLTDLGMIVICLFVTGS